MDSQQTESQIVDVLVDAAGKAFDNLKKNHNENFYYYTLIMDDCCTPYISAVSEETFHDLLSDMDRDDYDSEEDYQNDCLMCRWSFADTPYCAYGYDEYFGDVEKLFTERTGSIPEDDDTRFENEIRLWLDSMEKAMKILDDRKLFGDRDENTNIFINAEIFPEDDTNNTRGRNLNPTKIFEKWLSETEDCETEA